MAASSHALIVRGRMGQQKGLCRRAGVGLLIVYKSKQASLLVLLGEGRIGKEDAEGEGGGRVDVDVLGGHAALPEGGVGWDAFAAGPSDRRIPTITAVLTRAATAGGEQFVFEQSLEENAVKLDNNAGHVGHERCSDLCSECNDDGRQSCSRMNERFERRGRGTEGREGERERKLSS